MHPTNLNQHVINVQANLALIGNHSLEPGDDQVVVLVFFKKKVGEEVKNIGFIIDHKSTKIFER
jgi:sorbitol-specific phosphotransferase system component IIA